MKLYNFQDSQCLFIFQVYKLLIKDTTIKIQCECLSGVTIAFAFKEITKYTIHKHLFVDKLNGNDTFRI